MNNAKELRRIFLEDSKPVLNEIRCRTLGLPSVLPAADSALLIEYWNLAKQMILQADDSQKLQAESTQDVIKLLGKGKITVAEATDLMKLLRVQSDIDELPKLIEALEKANA